MWYPEEITNLDTLYIWIHQMRVGGLDVSFKENKIYDFSYFNQ